MTACCCLVVLVLVLEDQIAYFQICKSCLLKQEGNSSKRLYNKIMNFRNGWELEGLWVRQREKVISGGMVKLGLCWMPSSPIEKKQLIILGTVKPLITYKFLMII